MGATTSTVHGTIWLQKGKRELALLVVALLGRAQIMFSYMHGVVLGLMARVVNKNHHKTGGEGGGSLLN